uniref:Uncharacterized protein n=1 Tax=Anguilla anguilla TaxID=7936 RepID=A0A0E9SD18_ANGAN
MCKGGGRVVKVHDVGL